MPEKYRVVSNNSFKEYCRRFFNLFWAETGELANIGDVADKLRKEGIAPSVYGVNSVRDETTKLKAEARKKGRIVGNYSITEEQRQIIHKEFLAEEERKRLITEKSLAEQKILRPDDRTDFGDSPISKLGWGGSNGKKVPVRSVPHDREDPNA